MAALTKAQLLKLLQHLDAVVLDRMGHHSGSKVARGLAGEGWLGGYRAAINDVEALLRHGAPTDERGLIAAGYAVLAEREKR